MAERRRLTQRDLKQIVSRAEAGKTMRQIMDETGFGQSIVGPILVWGGFRKSRPDIRKHETAKVERWLGSAASSQKVEPVAASRKPRKRS